jgi:hypothetical protein
VAAVDGGFVRSAEWRRVRDFAVVSRPAYLVPALTVVLVLGLAAEARPGFRPGRAGKPGWAAAALAGSVTLHTLAAGDGRHDDEPR